MSALRWILRLAVGVLLLYALDWHGGIWRGVCLLTAIQWMTNLTPRTERWED